MPQARMVSVFGLIKLQNCPAPYMSHLFWAANSSPPCIPDEAIKYIVNQSHLKINLARITKRK